MDKKFETISYKILIYGIATGMFFIGLISKINEVKIILAIFGFGLLFGGLIIESLIKK